MRVRCCRYYCTVFLFHASDQSKHSSIIHPLQPSDSYFERKSASLLYEVETINKTWWFVYRSEIPTSGVQLCSATSREEIKPLSFSFRLQMILRSEIVLNWASKSSWERLFTPIIPTRFSSTVWQTVSKLSLWFWKTVVQFHTTCADPGFLLSNEELKFRKHLQESVEHFSQKRDCLLLQTPKHFSRTSES